MFRMASWNLSSKSQLDDNLSQELLFTICFCQAANDLKTII